LHLTPSDGLRFVSFVLPDGLGFVQPLPTRCVLQCGFAIYIEKYLQAKEELWKLKYFTMQKITKISKISSKTNHTSHLRLLTYLS
jgi:hypothetical protein